MLLSVRNIKEILRMVNLTEMVHLLKDMFEFAFVARAVKKRTSKISFTKKENEIKVQKFVSTSIRTQSYIILYIISL